MLADRPGIGIFLARVIQPPPTTGNGALCSISVLNAVYNAYCRCVPESPVAVGTTIADRPPHRSVRARLRIRLLPRMSGVKALIGVRVQNAGFRNPPVQQWGETIPSHLRVDCDELKRSATIGKRDA